MKKTLIALAALAATGAAFAQSTVTISGVLEVAPVFTAKNTINGVDTKVNRFGAVNTWSTSTLNITGTEDLGGGLKASFVLISGAGSSGSLGSGNTTSADSGIGNRERTLALSGDFGTVRWGRFVPAAIAGFHGLSGSGSATLAGSMYGLITASPTANSNFIHGLDGAGNARANMERQDNVLQYTSPSFNGVTVNVNVVNNTSDTSDTAGGQVVGKTRTSQQGLHVGYSSGPLALGIATNRAKNSLEDTTAVLAAATELRSTVNWVAGSYDFGMARVFAAYVTRDSKLGGAQAVDIKATSLGVSVPLDALTLRASVYRGTDKRSAAATDNMKLSGYQLAGIYALSKRTSLIAATGVNEIKRDSGSTAAPRKSQQTTLTVNHTF